MTIAEDFKKRFSQAVEYAGDYPGKVREEFLSGAEQMQREREVGLPGHLGASQMRYSLGTPLALDALSQVAEGLGEVKSAQQLGITGVLYDALTQGIEIPKTTDASMGAGIPAVLWGILKGKPLSAAKRKVVKFEPKRRGEHYVGTPETVYKGQYRFPYGDLHPPVTVRSIKNKADIQAVRNRMMDDMAQYATEEDFMWYRHIGKWIGDNVPNPENREIITRAFAWLSSDNQATANAKAAIKVLNEAKRAGVKGVDPDFAVGRFPNSAAEKLPDIFDLDKPFNREMKGVERKVETFYNDIKRGYVDKEHPLWTDPELLRRSTIDRHMMQFVAPEEWATKTIATYPQYDYAEGLVEDITRLYQEAGEKLPTGEDLIPSDIQAAQWAAKKRKEGKEPGSFAETAETHVSYVPYEYTPSASTEIGAYLESQPISVREEYRDFIQSRFIGPNGENLIYEDFGIPIYREHAGYGFYGEQLQPGVQAGITTGETRIQGKFVQRAQNARLAGLINKYVWDQDAVPVYRLTKLKKGMQAGIRVQLSEDASLEFLQKYGADLVETLSGLGMDKGDVGYTVVSPREIDVLNFDFSGIPNKQFIESLDGISKNYNEISSQQTWGIDANGRYYGPDISEGAIENAIRRYLGPDALRRLRSWRLEARGASAEFLEDQTLTLTHWSKTSDLESLDPSKHGTGLGDAASQRKAAFPDLWIDRTYFGLEGYEPEVGLGSNVYTTKVNPKELYDISGDPDGLRPSPKAGVHPTELTSKYEIAIKKAGYTGYWVEHDGKRMAAVFKPLKVNPVISAAKSIARRLILRR